MYSENYGQRITAIAEKTIPDNLFIEFKTKVRELWKRS